MRFRYLKDPLFLLCVLLYFINRWVLKPYFPNPFSRGYLNDVICLPFWVPIMLFIMRKIRLRRDDSPPRAHEILIPLLIWSWVFEAYLPFVNYFKRLATSDYMDIFSYTAGGLFAAIFWRIWYGECRLGISDIFNEESSPPTKGDLPPGRVMQREGKIHGG